MTSVLLSLLLSMQLLLADAPPLALPESSASPAHPMQENRLMWGLIDPELSAWFALLPADGAVEEDTRVLWDWSWRSFLAALFGDPVVKEVPGNGAHV